MNIFQAFRALGPIDIKSVQRDALLRWMVALPVVMGLALRYVIPFLAEQILVNFAFDITSFYMVGMSFIVQTTPLFYGSIIGFLLLDERDDRTLLALQVTPLSASGYLAYRISLPVLLSIIGCFIIVPLSGLVEMSVGALLIAALACAPLAPVFALFLGAFAQNKVQGFALMKSIGVVFLPAAVAYFVPMPWQMWFAVVVTYWPAKTFWLAQAGDPQAWIYLAIGLVYQAGLIWLMVGKFTRRVDA